MDVLAGERRDDLVGVHVRRRPRTGLEDVDRELVVELAGGDAVTGLGDALRLVLVEEAELRIHARGRGLDPAEPPRDRHRDRLTRDGKVGDRFVRLGAPEFAARLRLGHEIESSEGPARTGPSHLLSAYV